MEARQKLYDELGINQHHDAVTGTGKQPVANDYAKRLFDGMEKNNAVYNRLVSDKIGKLTGYTSDSQWQQCFVSNTTYVDCPINDMQDEKEYEMSVIVHNPSSVVLS